MATVSLSAAAQKAICDYVQDACNMSDLAARRTYMEWMDRQYSRRLDTSKETIDARLKSLLSDPTRFRNIIYPIVMPQVEAAVAYQAEVYCSGVPLFPVVSAPDFAAAATQLETVTDAQAERGGWGSELTMNFRDAFKYNVAALAVEWETVMSPLAEVTGKEKGTNQRKQLWAGNTLRRMDLYNSFYDPRVAPSAVSSKGEFFGNIEFLSRTSLRRKIAELETKLTQNEGEALAATGIGGGSSTGAAKFYVPNVGDSIYAKAVVSAFSWADYLRLPARNNAGKALGSVGDMYEVVTAYIRICPADFGISAAAPNFPQIFKVVIVGWRVIVHFSSVDTIDGLLPVQLCQAYEDGLNTKTNSLVENIDDMQQLATSFVNSAIAARRRAVADRAIYNPSLIDPKDIANPDPVARIPMKPSAMMTRSAADAYYAIPFNDNISGNALQEASAVQQLSFMLSGQNQADQGQFVKGNKTRSEFNTIMSKSGARDRITALHFEYRQLMAIKRHLKYNTLQRQGAQTLFSRDKQQAVNISPEQLRTAVMEFKMGDGMLPSTKLADADTLQVMLQVIPSMGQLAQQYDIGKVFMSIVQAGGVNVTDYKYSPEQVQYNQALAAWQQAAAQAAEKGAAFNVPMPQAPTQQG